ncbi:superoxide dismutase [Cu-Zn]-like isoform X2 [Dreissena polymorpha]|uniref:superoxide dismutase [Cu-Zn]-like isoform X2 n=1 Tax=Dreissena polymorpha TaxID=45954 RepID=UPI0022646C33|nr:superoxide dismutase [Cu-Zn]-like isoform X2 [Dreissena polymorpha]
MKSKKDLRLILVLSVVVHLVSSVPEVSPERCTIQEEYAVCILRPSSDKPSDINGTLYFAQKLVVYIDNVPLNDGNHKHGLHIHEFGDVSNGCDSMGPYYNPRSATHGGPWNSPNDRYVGDLGNVRQNPKTGRISVRIVDYMARLTGPESIIGRGIVLHANEDDLGVNKSDPESLKTGNAGARLACCVIARSPPIPDDKFTLYK